MIDNYGKLELTIGVPNDFDGHRCEYARQKVREKVGHLVVDAWVIQQTIPCEPPNASEGKEYYKFGGNVKLSRVDK